jgi:hypothetical protein
VIAERREAEHARSSRVVQGECEGSGAVNGSDPWRQLHLDMSLYSVMTWYILNILPVGIIAS